MSTPQAAVARPRRLQFTPRGAIFVLLVTAMLFYLVVPLRTYVSQRDRLHQLEQQERDLQRTNSSLQQRVQQLNDPSYVERVARECLHMARPGEIAFVLVPASGPPQPVAC